DEFDAFEFVVPLVSRLGRDHDPGALDLVRVRLGCLFGGGGGGDQQAGCGNQVLHLHGELLTRDNQIEPMSIHLTTQRWKAQAARRKRLIPTSPCPSRTERSRARPPARCGTECPYLRRSHSARSCAARAG